jgi:methylated-DNA-[protein]-cysteine S-methyltransferase
MRLEKSIFSPAFIIMLKKSFNERCYDLLRKVPKGKVTTYKALAKALKSKAYRAVGNAMNKNPYAPKVPCHRVINSNGEVGGFANGTKKKIEMLKKEGIEIKNNKIDLKKYMYKFK